MGDQKTDDPTGNEVIDNDTGDQEDVTTEDEGEASNKNTTPEDAEADADADDSESGGKDDEEESRDTAEDDEEPPMRKPGPNSSNKEWAAWRKQQKDAADNKSGKDTDADDTDDEVDIDPKVKAYVDKKYGPIEQRVQQEEIEGEVNNFLKDNPDFKPFESKVRKWAAHPSRQNVPVSSIFYEVAGPKMMELGAQRKAQADAKAAKTAGGSTTNAGESSGKNYSEMTDAEWQQEIANVKSNPRA